MIEQPLWRPLSDLQYIASLIDKEVVDTGPLLQTLTKCRDEKPYSLDDFIVSRAEIFFAEQAELIPLYEEQLLRWKRERPSGSVLSEIERLSRQLIQIRAWNQVAVPLVRELKHLTIERLLKMDDAEVGLRALLGEIPLSPGKKRK